MVRWLGYSNVGEGNGLLWIDDGAADDCVHILDFEPEKDKLVIRFDEPIEYAANRDGLFMTYDSKADATNIFAYSKKVSKIFCLDPSEHQGFYLGNFSQIA